MTTTYKVRPDALMTPAEHERAVVWVLAIVDEMIRRHEFFDPTYHRGLCRLCDMAVGTVCSRLQGYWVIHDSMMTLMRKHLCPPHSPSYWFGATTNCRAYKRRTKALNKLRAIVAAGDINPY